jgi:hypothetical protein
MRIRVVGSGIIAGLFCLTALWFPWYMAEPAGIVRDWTFQYEAANFPPWTSTAIIVFCALTVFAFGWVAARWNWASTWRSSLLDGAGSGLIAGCVAYNLIGAFHFGLIGQADILKMFYEKVGERQGLILLFEAVSSTAYLIFLNFIFIVFASTILGALGGLASAIDLKDVWGKSPRNPHRWLFRLSAYTLSLSGVGVLVTTIAVFTILQESLTEGVINENLTELTSPPFFVSAVAYLTGYVMILPAVGLTWGWIFRAWKSAGLWKLYYGVWLGASVLAVGWVLSGFVRFVSTGMMFDSFGFFPVSVLWLIVLLSLVFGFLGGALSEPASHSDEKYNFYDWLGFGLTQGILGGTQLFVGVTAYSLAIVLISIENIPHLILSELVPSLPAQQVILMSRMMALASQVEMVACGIGGWIVGLVVLSFRKFLKIKPVEIKPEQEEVE